MLNAQQNKILFSDKVLVMITIPLTRERYIKDLRSSASPFYFGKPKEYIRNEVIRLGKSWEFYYKNVACFILQDILELKENTNCDIDYDVTFREFSLAMKSAKYDVIFLIAHMINSGKQFMLEFADGGIKLSKVYKILSAEKEKGQAPIFLVCESQSELEKVKKVSPESITYIATSDWKIPVVPGFEFLKYWIMCINNNTLIDAYSMAISKYFHK